ncbi:hypothetical protein [Salinisphaera aquimarina]|uniref:Phosphatidate cytidylyltransferase n=1 Tax=Salinisphaera aquimarina TaxID=2094031 RepID=A0ABV7EKH3_9GAMM
MPAAQRDRRLHQLHTIAGPCSTPQTPQLEPLLAVISARFGDALAAVIYYGSCLRSGDPYDGLIDFYVVVDDYGRPGQSRIGALANRLVPPNVYYAERATGHGILRCKYAVLSVEQLEAGVGRRAFLSSIWGRFAQPVAIVNARSAHDHDRVRAACGEAVVTLLEKALPAVAPPASAADTFAAALTLSYASELRVERAGRSVALVAADAAEYSHRLRCAAPLLSFEVNLDDPQAVRYRPSAQRRQLAKISWPLRRGAGKLVSVARLVKACFTFSDAVDYAAFKIERHTGVAIEVTDRLRRHPLVFGWVALWRVYRQRLLR